MRLLKSYYLLCKPNVVYMMLICALVGMLLAEESVSSISRIVIALIGIAFCSGSAASINQVIDRKADASMTRTDQRPIPQGELSAVHASTFALVIGLIGALILYFFMKISHQELDALNALLTVAVDRKDFSDKVATILGDYRKKANIPGFRKGHVPMSLIKKQYEA